MPKYLCVYWKPSSEKFSEGGFKYEPAEKETPQGIVKVVS